VPTFLTSDGVRLHYEEYGEGRPVVFLAGWAMDGSWWRHQLRLSSDFRIVVLDPRAQGQSEKVTRGLRLARGAKDLHEFLRLLSLDDVCIVAWSRSASMALAYWELFGADRISRLVFIGITPCMSTRSDWEWGFNMPPSEFQDLIMADHQGVVEDVVDRLLYEPPTGRNREEMVRTTMGTPAIAGARMLEDHGVIDWRDMLDTIWVPTLVCVGRHDRQAMPQAAEHVARAVPRGELLVFEKSAHAPFFEEPETFNHALVDFLNRDQAEKSSP
jgi:pimeloyl-ACP methyl ester carboxylesterase